ncbi:SAF domain-containing protein [Krasilnikovia sp. MM14-A1004]|uniref:SAF domain-containing protein n=1 Tax=Krasilnikovia sp. MM14-A1004 TaxID=3373541 RepID=UPI00399CA46D
MSVTTDRSRPPAATREASSLPPTVPPVTRRPGRRSGRRIAAGVLIVIATVVVFWQVDLRQHADEAFLSTARPIAAGKSITDSDLTVVRVANTSGLALIAASSRSEVVGRTAAAPIPQGVLLTTAQVGPAAWPPSGQAVIALAVKPGRAPADLAAGATVVVLVVPSNAGQNTAAGNGAAKNTDGTRRAVATVVSVSTEADQVGTRLVTLLLAADSAETVASASGDASLVQIGAPR